MFKLENDAQRQRTIERIEEVKARIEKVRTSHGPEAAELYAKANRHHVAELEEQMPTRSTLSPTGGIANS